LDYSADQAERYGWINRAIDDSELDNFVDSLAHRMASFPHDGLIANKQRINDISLGSLEDYRADSALFGEAFGKPDTILRTRQLISHGLQAAGDFELNLGTALGTIDLTS
jgi:enoyl-CoA hydratase/carnithine racemase